jgi:hypothetical protein
MYYFQNGLKAETLENMDDLFIYSDENPKIQLITGELFNDERFQKLVDDDCISLYDIFLKRIFPDSDEYYNSLPTMPMWIKSVGHDSDFASDKESFEHLLNNGRKELVFKHLYYADCENLIGYLQSRIVGAKNVLAMFYINLANCEPVYIAEKDTTIWMTGENTTTVFALLVDFIISLYAILDITTKICYQLEHIPTDFSGYPSFASSIQYGNYNRLKSLYFKGTVFEGGAPTMKLIKNLRHELIHNGYLESVPKVFVEIVDGCVKGRWILMPDEVHGNLVAFKNRKRFYSQGMKANEKLMQIFSEFIERMLNTTGQLRSL